MTARHAGYVVVLAQDLREDDAEQTVAAIKQIKGVLDVRPVAADPGMLIGPGMLIARTRALGEIIEKLGKVLDDYI